MEDTPKFQMYFFDLILDSTLNVSQIVIFFGLFLLAHEKFCGYTEAV